MVNNFDRAAGFVLKQEVRPGHENDGDLTKDPRDPGGTTKWGIAQRYHPDIKVEDLTKEQAFAIYKKEYWAPAGCDALPWPLDIIVFDTAINQGVSLAQSLLLKYKDPNDYLNARTIIYWQKRTSPFFAGWIKRVNNLYWEIRK